MQKYLELIKTHGQILKTCKQHFLFLITYLQKNILMSKTIYYIYYIYITVIHDSAFIYY